MCVCVCVCVYVYMYTKGSVSKYAFCWRFFTTFQVIEISPDEDDGIRRYQVNGDHDVMVIVVGNGHGDTSSNPGRDWLRFHIALILLGKVWIQLFSLQLWVK